MKSVKMRVAAPAFWELPEEAVSPSVKEIASLAGERSLAKTRALLTDEPYGFPHPKILRVPLSPLW